MLPRHHVDASTAATSSRRSAAHLAIGAPFEDVGPAVAAEDLVRPPLPGAVGRRRRARDRGRLRRQLRQRPAAAAGRPTSSRRSARWSPVDALIELDDRRANAVSTTWQRTFGAGRRGRVAALRGLVRARLARRQPGQRRRSPGHRRRTSRSGSGRPDRWPDPSSRSSPTSGPSAPAVCRGVMFGIAPDANIIDINHQVPRYSIRDGAGSLRLRAAAHAGRRPRRGRRPGRRHGPAGRSRSGSPGATS